MPEPVTAKKTAVIYARVSTARQAEDELPIESQLEQCRNKARDIGAEIVGTFVDPGISGRDENRPAFIEAIGTCRDQRVTYFITWNTKRFARNAVYAELRKRDLDKIGTKVIYCTVEIDRSTASGILFDGMLGLIDEHYSRVNSEDTTRSMMKNARDGFWNGGCTPYGYRSMPAPQNPRRKMLEPVPEEAWIVGQIFTWRTSGVGARVIAGRLNKAGYQLRGRRWNASTVHFVLRNPAVNGFVCFGKFSGNARRPRDQWIMVKSHPPIVDDDLWNKVQAMMDEGTPHPGGSDSSTHLFTGLAKCGHCGAGMQMETAKGRSQRYAYYNCGAWLKTRACRSHRRRADHFDEWMLDTIITKVFTQEVLREVAIELNAECGTWAQEQREKTRALQAQLADTDRRKSKIMEIFELHGRDAPNMADLTDRLRTLTKASKALATEITALDAQEPPLFQAGEAELEAVRQVIAEIVQDRSDVRRARALLARLLEAVVITSDSAEIVYRTGLLASRPVHSVEKWLGGLNALGTRRLIFPLPERLRRAA